MDILSVQRSGVTFYACTDPAWAGAAHGFSTRLGGVSPAPWDSLNLGASRGDAPGHVAENFRRFCAAAGADSAVLVKNHQVHGDLVRTVGPADACAGPADPGTFEADGLATDCPGVCLAVFSADCIPVLLYDPVRRAVAAVHAGWRGTALGIAARAVERMAGSFGSQPEDILAAVGPGISQCCFETHRDVPDGLRAGLGGDAAPFIRPRPGGEGRARPERGSRPPAPPARRRARFARGTAGAPRPAFRGLSRAAERRPAGAPPHARAVELPLPLLRRRAARSQGHPQGENLHGLRPRRPRNSHELPPPRGGGGGLFLSITSGCFLVLVFFVKFL